MATGYLKSGWLDRFRLAVCLGCIAMACPGFAADAVSTDRTPPGYHRSEASIMMRDGVHLDTHVLAPDDTSARYPILLVRSPYDPESDWMAPEPKFLAARYIFVTQSVRGRYQSEGRFVHMTPQLDVKRSNNDVDASSDTYDTVDWLVKHVPNNNGRVGLRGVSYNGFYAAAGLIDAHPALLAVSPQAPQTDWFLGDDIHHNGAFLLASAYSWLKSCDRASDDVHRCDLPSEASSVDGYRYFLKLGPLRNAESHYFHGDSPEWQLLMTHGSYDDLWQQRSLVRHLRDIKPAVLVVSGWYDASNLFGALRVFDAVHRQSPSTTNTLVLGPWTHGQWGATGGSAVGALHFGADTATDFINDIELPFFELHLKGAPADLPVARVFDTGSMQWHSFDAWPPKPAQPRLLYVRAGGKLSFDAPVAGLMSAGQSYDEYTSDPARPVPFLPDHGFDMDGDYMAHDQRFASHRKDVVVYRSAPLTQDLTVIGPVRPQLVVSTSGTDSDWIVKLIDVHASNGFEELVRGDVMRGKFRDSFETPTPMVSGMPTRVGFEMPDVYHTFKKGDRIMVQVQSSWFPLIDRNPQRFLDIYSATAADFHPARQRIYHSAELASRLELEVLPAAE